jgi:hypothetical protein
MKEFLRLKSVVVEEAKRWMFKARLDSVSKQRGATNSH